MSISTTSSQDEDGNASAITHDSQDDLQVNDEDSSQKSEVVVFRNLPVKLINCIR